MPSWTLQFWKACHTAKPRSCHELLQHVALPVLPSKDALACIPAGKVCGLQASLQAHTSPTQLACSVVCPQALLPEQVLAASTQRVQPAQRSQLRKVLAGRPLGEDALVQAGAHGVLLGDGRIELALHGAVRPHRLLQRASLVSSHLRCLAAHLSQVNGRPKSGRRSACHSTTMRPLSQHALRSSGTSRGTGRGHGVPSAPIAAGGGSRAQLPSWTTRCCTATLQAGSSQLSCLPRHNIPKVPVTARSARSSGASQEIESPGCGHGAPGASTAAGAGTSARPPRCGTSSARPPCPCAHAQGSRSAPASSAPRGRGRTPSGCLQQNVFRVQNRMFGGSAQPQLLQHHAVRVARLQAALSKDGAGFKDQGPGVAGLQAACSSCARRCRAW